MIQTPLGEKQALALLLSLALHIVMAALPTRWLPEGEEPSSSLSLTFAVTSGPSGGPRSTAPAQTPEVYAPQPPPLNESLSAMEPLLEPDPTFNTADRGALPEAPWSPPARATPRPTNPATTTVKEPLPPRDSGASGLTSLTGLFDSTATGTSPSPSAETPEPVVATTASGFQRYLLEHISNKRYHDRQYPYSRIQEERAVTLRIRLHPNGTLVRADVVTSSGDPALDAAAQRATLAASPFEPPPREDRRGGYEYLITIRYEPGH